MAFPHESLATLRKSRVLSRVADIVAPADIAEAVCQVGEDACAWRLLSLHAVCVEARDNLPDAHQMVNCWAARDGAR